MIKIRKIYRKIARNRLMTSFIDLRPRNFLHIIPFIRQYKTYKSLSTEQLIIAPIFGEDTATTNIDPHYFYQAIWATRHIAQAQPIEHVDVGSQAQFVAFLTVLTKVKFVDIRPLNATLENMVSIKGSILNLQFPDNSIRSLSCLHVAEHIGLGRYGDPIDPRGTQKACQELTRVLAPKGRLYFSVPIGKERVEFNAHRVFTPATILKYFENLKLLEFCVVNDAGQFIRDANLSNFSEAKLSCGLFLFTK